MTPAPHARLLAACAAALFLGCGKPPAGPTAKSTARGPSGADALGDAIKGLQEARQPTDCRTALALVERHLNNDARGKDEVRAASAALAKLQGRLGLDADEVEYAAGTAFRPMDAHHAYQCLLLRDAAESLDVQGLPPLRQAEEAFAWVVRQATLRSGVGDAILPPEAVLQVGEGSAHERAVLFLALLHQLDLDGCMVAVPGDGPAQDRYWIPGALVPAGGRAEVYLFDTRLGVPVPGPGGKGVATLRQVRDDPGLLAQLAPDKAHPYDVTPEEARRAEVRLVLPLAALAPRMKYLEGQMARHAPVRLAVDAAGMLQRFAGAAGGKVGVWNWPTSPGQPAPWTPTRALRRFLIPEEGGLDRDRVWLNAQREQMAAEPAVVGNLRDLAGYDDLPAEVRDRLRQLALGLFWKYPVRARDRLARGRLDDATRRLTRINGVVQEFRAEAPPPAVLREKIAAWRGRLLDAYLALARGGKSAQKAVDSLWSEDQYVLALAALTEEDDELPRLQRGALTYLVLGADAGPLEDDVAFLLARCWQEKAARARPEDAGKEGGRDAWENAASWARGYADRHPFGAADVRRRLGPIEALWQPGARRLDAALGAWDRLFRDVRRAATARLLVARALREAGKEDEARAALRRLADDLAALRQNRELRDALAESLQRVPLLPAVQQGEAQGRLERLTAELGPAGGLTWLERGARREARGR